MATLNGKKALVLGGSRGIGAAIVRRLSADGANTTFTYAGSAAAAQALASETGTSTVQVDSSDRHALTQFIQSQGSIDILVISAGTLVMGDPLELDADAIDHMIDVNVRAPYHAAVEAARQMPDGGRIIVIGSVNGDRMPMAGAAAYALSKSAVQGLVRGLARDLGSRNITVNNVQPGPVDTEMNPAAGPFSEFMHSFMAIKRHGRADEIAGFVAYLAGPEAGYITGAQHTIDGGFGA
ncbi:oxidoreductase [Pokkaliibacter plantistimulans]|uniref:Oxidoreductase n=1 Tax=Proteobacteria bacterium 228 TaxID=2083153 RepID=A0A2S5KX28_9PROT|nr:SDR family oxidoreductase [Pokkaliibacter plantistimulans]PPC78826.1 oxidoreductase [Pokkaliibacter plantistimulans]